MSDPRREMTYDEAVARHPEALHAPFGQPEHLVSGEQMSCIHCGHRTERLDTRGLLLEVGGPVFCGMCHRHAWTVVEDGLVQVVPQ